MDYYQHYINTSYRYTDIITHEKGGTLPQIVAGVKAKLKR